MNECGLIQKVEKTIINEIEQLKFGGKDWTES